MTSMREQIVEVIRNRQSILIDYQGYARYLSPHAIGFKTNAKGERSINMLAYQYDGETSKGPVEKGSGHKENWRCMDVSKIKSIEIIEDKFYTSNNHSVSSNCIDEYIAEVDF